MQKQKELKSMNTEFRSLNFASKEAFISMIVRKRGIKVKDRCHDGNRCKLMARWHEQGLPAETIFLGMLLNIRGLFQLISVGEVLWLKKWVL